MPNINKVVFGSQTLIDLSTTTLSQASQLANGVTAYDRSGNVITGTSSGGGSDPYVLVTGEYDANGGKIVHITGAVNETITADSGGGDIDAMSATVLLDLSNDTVDPAHLISGYTAHNSMGEPITGTSSPGTAALGEKTITANGTYNASSDSLDGYSSVTVNVPSSEPDLQTKSVTITPTTSQQTQTVSPDSGKDGLSSVSVTVNAMPSGSTSTPATTITANPSISVSASGLITATASASKSVTPSVSAGYVSSGTAGTVSVSGSNTQQLSTQAATTITPTKTSQTAVSAGKYTTGAVTVAAIPDAYQDVSNVNATAADVVLGKTIVTADGVARTGTLEIQRYYTGSSEPAASVGSDGDIYLMTS